MNESELLYNGYDAKHKVLLNHKTITSSLEHMTCCEFKCFIDVLRPVLYLQTVILQSDPSKLNQTNHFSSFQESNQIFEVFEQSWV